jgi:hypothetical protein
MVRDPDIGTDQECFACDGTGKVEQEEPAAKPEGKAEDLYRRLESLSKSLESSGRVDEHESPGAYASILDAMNFVRRAACDRRNREAERAARYGLDKPEGKSEHQPVIKDSLTTEAEQADHAFGQEVRSLIANLAAVVRIQNGNLYEDVNSLLEHADRILAHPPAYPQPDISTPSTQAQDMSIESGNFDRSEQLTDEEILALWHSSIKGVSLHPEVIEFARALLSRHKASGEEGGAT